MAMMSSLLPNDRRGPMMAQKKAPQAGLLMCVRHNKMRGPNNVEETFPNSREFHCKRGSECKVSENRLAQRTDGPIPNGPMTCALHGKVRGPNNIEPTFPGSGTWKCKAGSECKMPAPLKPLDPNAPPGPVQCVVHGKQRGPNNVEETYPGSRQYRCRTGSECKLPANNDGVPQEHVGQPQTCALHGKVRGPNNVVRLPTGLYQCKPGSECKMSSKPETESAAMYGQPPIHPSGPTLCWAHQKKRSPNQLHQVNTPLGAQWECLPQFKCKGASNTPGISQLPGAGGPFPGMPTSLQAGIPDMQQYGLPQQLLMQQPMSMMQQLGAGLGPH